MSQRTWRRWAATLAATAVTLLGGALGGAAAHADGGPTFQLNASDVGLAVPSDGDGQISWGLDTKGATIHDVKITVDLTGISAFADSRDSFCVDGLCTWDPTDVGPNGTGGVLDIAPKAGAALGTKGTAVITGTSSDATILKEDVTVTVGAVDLLVDGIKRIDDATPGSTLTAPITLANTGSLTASQVDYRFVISPGLAFAQRFSNCDYGTTSDDANSGGQTVEDAVCHLSTPVEPGQKYQLSTPLKLKVKNSALFEFLSYQPTTISTAVPSSVQRDDSGSVLSLVADGKAPVTGQEQSEWIVNATNTADIAVTGDTATAAPGSEVTLTAKIGNLGPASVGLFTTDTQLSLLVDIPKGTAATKVPAACGPYAAGAGKGRPKLGAPQYICDLDRPFNAGHSEKLDFTVKVDADAPATTTSAVQPLLAFGGKPPYDTDKANSTGHFTVNVPGSATTSATGGSGSSSGSGSNGNQAKTQTGALTGATSGTSGSTDPATGSLASTGSNGAMTLAWIGAAAVALGGAIFAVVRSRKAHARA
jgi:LPXTG-motif cell wall-anchored protein